jgi:hypothetical protein
LFARRAQNDVHTPVLGQDNHRRIAENPLPIRRTQVGVLCDQLFQLIGRWLPKLRVSMLVAGMPCPTRNCFALTVPSDPGSRVVLSRCTSRFGIPLPRTVHPALSGRNAPVITSLLPAEPLLSG